MIHLLALLSLITAPGEHRADVTPHCAARPANWMSASAPSDTIANVIGLKRGGAMTWNSRPIDGKTMRQYLTQAARLNPKPRIVLQYDSGASCKAVYDLRATVARLYDCGKYYCRELGISS